MGGMSFYHIRVNSRFHYFWAMAGIYVHIPFCKQQCSYCDFHFSTTFSDYRTEMIDAICKELSERKEYLEDQSVSTIYFGGGTPSILTKHELAQILETIHTNFEVVDPEISMEANPDDISRTSLQEWKSLGVNRLSIGLQSFKQEDLKWMNRAHSVTEAENCVELARSFGFENLTVDLMYGLPGLTLDEWKNHVEKVIAMGVSHISAYCLTVEEKTALNNWVKKGKIIPASEDQQSDQFVLLLELLEKNGFYQYEISNFCLPGSESGHNSNYWKGAWYLGVGPSAHSFNGSTRSWNVANNRAYLKGIANETFDIELEQLSNVDQFNERILTGLRTVYGVPLDEIKALATPDENFERNCREFMDSKWMKVENNRLVLTKEGRLRADYIASELFL